MVDLKCINLLFSVNVTATNINTIKKLFNETDMVKSEEDKIEIGENIILNCCFEQPIGTPPEVISLALLFNGDLVGKPMLKLSKE